MSKRPDKIKLHRERKSKGICVKCGKAPARSNKVNCIDCARKARGIMNRMLNKRRKEGLCTRCGNPTEGGLTKCQKHTRESRIRDQERIKQLKLMAIEYKGGKCEDCHIKAEFPSVYDFHHADPENKKSNIRALIRRRRSWVGIKEELDRCVLLCANCHRIRHAKENYHE